jgi:hypothetical protein
MFFRPPTCQRCRSQAITPTEGGSIVEAHEGGGAMNAQVGLPLRSAYESMSIEELARLKGLKPVTSLADMACDVLEPDEETEEFIAFTNECRREGLA